MFSSRVHIRPNRRPNHGFTLVELMVVVVIITALSALAIPSIIKQMRDRRTREAAEEVAAVYRQARLRALGRGSAVVVRYTNSAGIHTYQTLEAVIGSGTGTPGPGCAQLPVASCTNTNWGIATSSQLVTTLTLPNGMQSEVFSNLSNGGNGMLDTPQNNLDVCFTPMGRTLVAGLPGSQLQTMSGVPVIRVTGTDTTRLKRFVLIPPNGLARTDVAQ